MMQSLITDPLSRWPLGVVIGSVLGAVVRRYEKRRATADPMIRPSSTAAGHDDRESPASIQDWEQAEMRPSGTAWCPATRPLQ